MTEEQAINVLLMVETHNSLALKAKIMAIEALKQKSCDDAISRKELLELMGEEPFNWTDSDKELQEVEDYRNFKNMIEQLPSVNPAPSGDVISRKSIKHKLQEHHDFFVNAYGGFSNLPQNDKARVDEISNCIAMVVNEPTVNPQEPKTGHWKKISYKRGRIGWDNIIEDDYYFECSECKGWSEKDFNYCHWCGTKMVEPQERSEG